MSCDWRRAGHVTTVLPSDWCRYPSMQELGEALVGVLDSLNIEYVVGLGEGAGANILARWRLELETNLREVSWRRPPLGLRALSFPSSVGTSHCPYHCNFHWPGSGWRTRQDVWASF